MKPIMFCQVMLVLEGLAANIAGVATETWKKRKQGFSVPLSEWFCGELGNKLLCLLGDYKDHSLSSSHIETMLEQHRAGITDHSMGLWAIYSYLMWKLNMKPEPACGT